MIGSIGAVRVIMPYTRSAHRTVQNVTQSQERNRRRCGHDGRVASFFVALTLQCSAFAFRTPTLALTTAAAARTAARVAPILRAGGANAV